ncbi:MAG: hypothetical protein ABJH06_10355 [Paraglaciecola sp.]|uniref:hypothetical protein n=1 Tax=Paraglaciecola sp. TaxID=1920173 RepID=UPI00329A3AA7
MERIVRKYGDNLFFVYMIVGIIPVLIYETEFNTPFHLAFKYLSIPILSVCLYVYFFKIPNWKRNTGKIKGLCWTLMIAAMLILLSGGYILGVNSLIGTQTPTEVNGEIVKLEKNTSSKGGTSYIVSIKDNSNKLTKLLVSKDDFIGLKKGQLYQDTWFTGSLGLLYKK